MLTTQDILFIVLAFCALWFTAFLCWFLYQLTKLLKRAHLLIDEVRVKIHEVEGAVAGLKRKFDSNVETLGTLAMGVRKIIEALKIK